MGCLPSGTRERLAASVDDRKNGGYEEERGHGRENETANHGTAERCILLAAITQAQGKRHHADDHCQRGHQNRPQTCEAGISAAVKASSPARMRSRAKLITSTLLAVATPMHMIEPVKTGTLTVVCVRNSIQTMPAKAAGRALMMMSGSSKDWKFTTISM